MSRKRRLSASVDADLIEAAEEAVARGGAETLSAWVNDALRLKLGHDQRQEVLAAFIAEYEAEHGEIGEAEIRMASRRASARALRARSLDDKQMKQRRRRSGHR